MEAIKEFVTTLIVFIFFSICGQNLIASANFKKMYRFFVGLVLIVLVINFIFKFKGISASDIFKDEYRDSVLKELESQINAQVEYISSEALVEYKNILTNNIKDIVMGEGYSAKDIYIELNEETKQIEKISMTIIPYTVKSDVEEIKEVSVNIENTSNYGDGINKSQKDGEDKEIYIGESVNANNSVSNTGGNIVIIKLINDISYVYGISAENVVISMEE
ncbi:MAG: stage III sporulation protein AF [Lachnospiraceae bacterium]|nr:stage III sporulation protein AF [Lachnospiraceae bacterium]MDE6698644.1 stage III sporulation protein AF [Lachnospiraceae bacterium]